MKKKSKHIPGNFMARLYSHMALRFVVYSAYGYSVSLIFTYAYFHLTMGNGGMLSMKDAFVLMPYSAMAYALVIGYFAIRDAIEKDGKKISGVLAKLPA